MSGYDQFFKEAGKAAGLTSGNPKKPSAQGKPGQSKQAQGKPKFKLKADSVLDSREVRTATPPSRSGSAENRLRQEMAERAKARRKTSNRKRQAFPLIPAIIAVVAIVTCTVGFLKPDLADQLLSHIEIGAFGKANAAEKDAPKKTESNKEAAAALAKSGDAKTPDAAKVAETKAIDAAKGTDGSKTEVPPDFRNWSDEELSFFNKLNDRKKELDLREAELNKLDEELQKQKAELDQKIKQLESMRADISKTLKTRVDVDQEKVEKLVQFYSTMKPQQAAKVIESINEDLAVEVIDKMKKKDAAAIMDALKPEKARRLSELLTGYQRSPANEAEEKGDAKTE